eukprot:1160625-Pelagomonas_calceolata.AAC.6
MFHRKQDQVRCNMAFWALSAVHKTLCAADSSFLPVLAADWRGPATARKSTLPLSFLQADFVEQRSLVFLLYPPFASWNHLCTPHPPLASGGVKSSVFRSRC